MGVDVFEQQRRGGGRDSSSRLERGSSPAITTAKNEYAFSGKGFSIKFDLAALNNGLDQITTQSSAVLRASAGAGAVVLRDEVLARVPVSKKPRKAKAGHIIQPGALKNSIYYVYSKSRSNKQHAEYHVSWNYTKAPHGHLVEFGTSQAPAHPFLRPAYDAKAEAALEAARAEWVKQMQPVVDGGAA